MPSTTSFVVTLSILGLSVFMGLKTVFQSLAVEPVTQAIPVSQVK